MTIQGRTLRSMVAAAFGIAALAGFTSARAHTADLKLDAVTAAHHTSGGSYASARALLDLAGRPWPNALSKAVAIAKSRTAAYARDADLDIAFTVAPTHASPGQAAQALASLYGVVADAEQISRLDTIAAPVRGALTRLIDAFISVQSAARTAFGSVDAVALRSDTNAHTSQKPIDPAGVIVTRNHMLDAVLALQEAAASGVATTGSCSPIAIPPAFSIDLGACDNTYNVDIALLVDASGNDTYFNNAGGARGLLDLCEFPPLGELPPLSLAAAALIDLSGDDGYGKPAAPRSCGANGGGFVGGVGFLLDAEGNDKYSADNYGTNGGARLGAGFLLDAMGDDTYTANGNGVNAGGHGTNGGGSSGVGFLLDVAGNDTYTAGSAGTNGGAAEAGASGFLLDAEGNDTYAAGNSGTNGGGLGSGTMGFLLDLEGSDTYTAGDGATNGGGNSEGATGFLLDAEGNDQYHAGGSGTNGGALGGPGATGFLLDLGGDDSYTGGYLATNGEGYFGVGLLVDAGGTDVYSEAYSGPHADCTRAPKGLGAQIDVPNTTC